MTETFPLSFRKRGNGAFYENIIGNFMVHQDRIETNLLQLFAHLEISDWFSTIFGVIFEVTIVAEQKKA